MISALYFAFGLLSFLARADAYSSLKRLSEAKSFKNQYVPNRFIIEYEDNFLSKRDVVSTLAQNDVKIKINKEYNSPVFQGASINVADSKTVSAEDLKKIDGIKDAWPVTTITLDHKVSESQFASWNPHQFTGVDELHKRNITGAGVTIAVIDTGVEADHDVFGGKMGGDSPIAKGFDISGDPEHPTSNFTDCVGHGTFVSSVIAGRSKEMMGVAPDAKIIMFKVFENCSESTDDDNVLTALLKAYDQKPDIISVSIGVYRGYSSLPIAKVASKIGQDTVVVFAAGNGGKNGPFYANGGASDKNVLAVASSHSKQMIVYKAFANSSNGDSFEFVYADNEGYSWSAWGTYEAVISDVDSCLLNGTDSKSGDKKMLLVKQGGCDTEKLYVNLNKLGFPAALVYMNSPSHKFTFYYAYTKLGLLRSLGQTSYEFGQWAVQQKKEGNTVNVTFVEDSKVRAVDDMRKIAGNIDYYSSWGPTFENDFFPHFAAPGGEIFGATKGNKYTVFSGTSFSCPYTAGVAALYLSHYPNATPAEIRSKLISTSQELPLFIDLVDSSDETVELNKDMAAPGVQQGAGELNALKLFDVGTTLVSDSFLAMNDTNNRISEFEVKIKNGNDKPVTYTISHTAFTTVYSRNNNWFINNYFPEYNKANATVRFSTTSLTLGPGAQGSVVVNIDPPEGLDVNRAPIFTGKIQFLGSNGDYVNVPYMGVEVKTIEWSAWHEKIPPVTFGYNVTTETSYNITSDTKFNPANGLSPLTSYTLRYGARLMSFDLVDEDYDISKYSYPPKIGENGYHGPIVTTYDEEEENNIYFPSLYPARANYYRYFSIQSFANKSSIPDGTYRLLARAINIFADLNDTKHWDLVLLDPFMVDTSLPAPDQIPTQHKRSNPEDESIESSSSDSPDNSILNVIVTDQTTGDQSAYVDDWFTLTFTLDITSPPKKDSVTVISVPGFEDMVESVPLNIDNDPVAFLTSSAGVINIKWTDYATRQSSIKGNFSVDARLDPGTKDAIRSAGSGTKEFVISTSTKVFKVALDFVRISAPIRQGYWDGHNPVWVVDVPSSLGSWSSLSLFSDIHSLDYSYKCVDSKVLVGFALNSFGNATLVRAMPTLKTAICKEKSQIFTLDKALRPDELLRFVIVGSAGSSAVSFANEMTLKIVLGGHTKEYVFKDTIHIRPGYEVNLTGKRIVTKFYRVSPIP